MWKTPFETEVLIILCAYETNSFVFGSFPLYKKYGYISNFSDLDVALIYDDKISKNRNSQRLKEAVDNENYEQAAIIRDKIKVLKNK